jgi:UDP-GlcNAc:undecaprenyl-phosphate GlcNAc-1-phosphate transferase
MAMNTACKSGWRLPRYNFIEAGLKGWIRIWRTRAAAIRISFGIVKTGVPILILVSCLLPSDVPQPLSGGALAAAILVAATWFAGEAWMRWGLRVALYLLIPVALYLGTEAPVPWIPPWMLGLYNLCFPAMVLFSILTLKLTRRTQGFAVSPLDFLILFIAVGLPLFPGTFLQSPRAGFLAARIIVLFFSYEVLMGELRGDMRWPGGTTVVALALLGVKGLY